MLAVAQKAIRKIVYRGGSPVYYARKYLELARTLNESKKRHSVARDLARSATADDHEINETLNHQGFVVLPKPLDLTEELIAQCHQLLARRKQKANSEFNLGTKYFWDSLLTNHELTADSIFLRFAAQEHLLRLAAIYLNQAPYLSNISLTYSFPTGKEPTHSQLWHRDADDTRLFLVFVYCTDVLSRGDGPFTVADRGAAGWRQSPLLPMRSYKDEDFKQITRPESIHEIYGNAGTTFICDTKACFHFGSRCLDNPRLACWFTYQSYTGLYAPANPKWSNPIAASPAQKLLLSRGVA
jgi:hypothetical protein